MREVAGLAPLPPPPNHFVEYLALLWFWLWSGRRGTCRELPDRPRWLTDGLQVYMLSPAPASCPAVVQYCTRMCHPRDGLTPSDDVYSPPTIPAQSPYQLCASYCPGHTRRSTQHGGSDHRRLRSDSPMAAATKRCYTLRSVEGESLTFFCLWVLSGWC